MRRFNSFAPALLVLVLTMSVIVFAPRLMSGIQRTRTLATIRMAQAKLDQPSGILEQLNEAYESIAEATLPGVVHIEAKTSMREFVNNRRTGDAMPAPGSTGSGWVYNEGGHIITNAHVVSGHETIEVEFHDGRVREAEVVGLDSATDIAVLKVGNVSGLFPLRRATKEPVRMGDQVFAFGSPFGIKFSMSRGIVSGLGRGDAAHMMGMRRGYTNFIQTDAAMNPGNSGGPLVDIYGRVIGMNAAIANNAQPDQETAGFSGQSAGIGFAIPLETVESVVDQIIDSKMVLRGYLGVLIGDTSAEYAESIGLNRRGVVVTGVPDDQPAYGAGIRTDDVIIEIDGTATPTTPVLMATISAKPPSHVAMIKVWRDGKVVELRAPLGAAEYYGGGLHYIPGSEKMTIQEIRESIKGRRAE
ncbi:MAG: trypsin-like peptidase domain-containing protein [Phycisphaeraceae bacterium]|nr:trypsin-like peptidase domain-containing protein [Phycisphaerales bacterium]MCB9843248.1 trypsin-like peptidase domain-containing protein [Phycisphaeraceae bacterium]